MHLFINFCVANKLCLCVCVCSSVYVLIYKDGQQYDTIDEAREEKMGNVYAMFDR